MKRLLWLGIPALVLVSSCAKDLDYEDNPKLAKFIPAETLVTNAEVQLGRTLVSTSVNLNPFRLWVQQLAETSYPDESKFDFTTRQINNTFWNTLYREVLADLNEAKRLVNAEKELGEDVKKNQLAVIEVLSVYTWSILVDNYGDIPYTDALDAFKSQPKYDDDQVIYADLITRLDNAMKLLNDGAGFGGGDLIYGGEGAKWLKLANSLKLKLAMTIADVDPAKAKTLAEAASSGAFMSSEDNAILVFNPTPPNTNPLWEDLVQSGRIDFIATDYFLSHIDKDPRKDEFFYRARPDVTTFEGGTAGDANGFSYSLPRFEYGTQKSQDYVYSNYLNADGTVDLVKEGKARNAEREALKTVPSVLMTYTEVEFFRAEAVARGFNVGGTVEEHYNKAIVASIVDEWGNSEAEALAYLASPEVAYDSPTNAGGTTYKEKIGYQKWIALFMQPVESWKEYRRLDSPKLVKPAAALTEIPFRYTYPIPESNVNGANYTAASTAIGGDLISTKVFWDKF